MKIAFHFLSLSQGGVERMRLVLAEELLARGYEVDLVVCDSTGDLRPLVPSGAQIIDLKARRTIHSVIPLARYLTDQRPDAVFSSLGHQNLAAIFAKKISRSRSWLGVIQHNALGLESSSLTMQHRLLPFMYRLFLRYADGVMAVSKGVAEDLAKHTGFPQERVHVAYNPALPKLGSDFSGDAEHKFFSLSGVPVYIGVGRLAEQKGFDILLKAFAILLKERDARLILCGVGPDEMALKALCAELDLTSAVDFIGFQARPIDWIARSDIFVLSSRYEGFGNVLVEALAAGIKIVSTDCDFGPNEVLEGGRHGVLVMPDDIHSLYRGMLDVLGTNIDAPGMRTRAADFSVGRVVDNYLTIARLPLSV